MAALTRWDEKAIQPSAADGAGGVGGRVSTERKLAATWEFSQFIMGKLIYTAYSGGDRDDAYGQSRKWDNVGVELQYEF